MSISEQQLLEYATEAIVCGAVMSTREQLRKLKEAVGGRSAEDALIATLNKIATDPQKLAQLLLGA